ncbi:MAG: hypothetical protein H0U54_01910, partial [Acidobacteria bacterium]|nr:hypothetical protein [Acidobacteriota bacterium]
MAHSIDDVGFVYGGYDRRGVIEIKNVGFYPGSLKRRLSASLRRPQQFDDPRVAFTLGDHFSRQTFGVLESSVGSATEQKFRH